MIRLLLLAGVLALGLFALIQFLRSVWPKENPREIKVEDREKLHILYKPVFNEIYNAKQFIFDLLDKKEHRDLKDTLSSMGIIDDTKQTVRAAFQMALKLTSIENYLCSFTPAIMANKKQHIEELKTEIPYHRGTLIAQNLTKQMKIETDELAYIEELRAKQSNLYDELEFVSAFMQNIRTYVVKLSVGDDVDMIELQASFDCLSSSLAAVDEVQKMDKRATAADKVYETACVFPKIIPPPVPQGTKRDLG